MAQNSESKDDSRRDVEESSLSSIGIVQNMALAHELVMDETFKINEEPTDSLKGQIKQIVHKAFWDNLEEELAKEPPNYAPALRLLAELKETLLSVLFEHNVKFREQINNVIDLELIIQQSQQGTVDIQGYAAYIIDVMSKICTPARDEDIAKLKNIEGLVPLFREIFRVLDLMKLDMANFCLSQFRPQLVQQSVEFEQNKFREYLAKNPDGLQSTTRWIKQGIDDMRIAQNEQTNNYAKNDVKNVNATTDANVIELSETIKYSYVGIVLGIDDFPYPETLIMDQHRLLGIRQAMQCVVSAASVLVVTLNMVGSHLASDSEYKKTLKENIYFLLKGTPSRQLQNVFPNIGEQVLKETMSFVSKRGLQTWQEENMNSLKGQIINLADSNHTVCQLIRKRVKDFLMAQLFAKEASTSFPAALKDVEDELKELTKQFAHIASYNFAVFRPFYAEIIKELT